MDRRNKIRIRHISAKARQSKGFDHRGCFDCACDDRCCRFGADFDRETYDLLMHHRPLVEERTGRLLDDCFEIPHATDPEFLGGGSRRSLIGQNGFCAFHKPHSKGCVLFELVLHHACPPRIVPSICRLFPLTWDKGQIMVYDEIPGGEIPRECNVHEPENITDRSLFETQQSAIADVFEFDLHRSAPCRGDS